MVEIIVAIIVVICIIYIFKGDFIRRNVGVTVLENLPLSIFKKWGKEEEDIKEYKNINEVVSVEINDIKVNANSNINERDSQVLEEVAIDTLTEEIEEVKFIDKTDSIDEVNNVEKTELIELVENINEIEERVIDEFNNSSENIDDILINDVKEFIENKEIMEKFNEESKEEDIVYWTPKGKTYHAKNTCRTLSRSKVIHSGTVYESGKDFKCEHCK